MGALLESSLEIEQCQLDPPLHKAKPISSNGNNTCGVTQLRGRKKIHFNSSIQMEERDYGRESHEGEWGGAVPGKLSVLQFSALSMEGETQVPK